jgi:hypothetical protein
MQARISLLGAFALCAAQSAIAAGDPHKIEVHALSPEASDKAALGSRVDIRPAPIHTEMHATVRPDGSIELHCKDHAVHASYDRPPTEERPR